MYLGQVQTVAPGVVATVPPPSMVPLPSQSSANDVVNGVPGAVPKAGLHFLGRAAIIAVGINVLAGEKRWGRAAVEGLAGSAAIEAFVLGWCWWHRGQG